MDNPFLQAVFVQPREVMGRQLRPFSAYHAAALMLLDSPFFTKDNDGIGAQDLVLAIYVCSFGFEDGPQALFPDVNINAIEAWADKCTNVDFEEELSVFSAYMDDYLETPEIWQPAGKGSGKESGIPWPVYCVTAVLQNMKGISEQDAWNMPLSRLVAYKCAIAEQNGADIVSQAQRHRMEWIRLTEEAEKAEKEARDGVS